MPVRFAALFLFLVFGDRLALAQEQSVETFAVPGYDMAGYIDDLNATKLLYAISVLAQSMELDESNEFLLLPFIGRDIIQDNRIADFGLEAFSKEQSNALAELSVDGEQCNLKRLSSDLDEDVHLLAIDTARATDADVSRCILVFLTRTQGVEYEQTEKLTNRELIVEFLERL